MGLESNANCFLSYATLLVSWIEGLEMLLAGSRTSKVARRTKMESEEAGVLQVGNFPLQARRTPGSGW